MSSCLRHSWHGRYCTGLGEGMTTVAGVLVPPQTCHCKANIRGSVMPELPPPASLGRPLWADSF